MLEVARRRKRWTLRGKAQPEGIEPDTIFPDLVEEQLGCSMIHFSCPNCSAVLQVAPDTAPHEAGCDLGDRCPSIVPINTFAPEPFDLLKEIKVVVEESDGEYIATFYDANVASQGCTRQEAFDNLKDLLLSRFDHLDRIAPEKLGKSTKRQIAVLREFIRRRD